MALIVLARGYRYNAFREIERRHLAPSAPDNIRTCDERRLAQIRFDLAEILRKKVHFASRCVNVVVGFIARGGIATT